MNANFTPNIKIDAEFFKLIGTKLYTNPPFAILVRELLQNSRDAKAKNITFTFSRTGQSLIVTCTDDGTGMNADTLFNIFLTVGRSGKTMDSTAVGGFGVAKVALFSMDEWCVRTQKLFVNSSGEYGDTDGIKGTSITAKITCHQRSAADVLATALYFLYSSDVKGLNIVIDETTYAPFKGNKRIFLNDDVKVSLAGPMMGVTGYTFYRIQGLTQYFKKFGWGDYPYNIIVEVKCGYRPTDERYPFSLSRESVNDNIDRHVRAATERAGKNRRTTAVELHRAVNNMDKEHVRKINAISIGVDAPSKIPAVHRSVLKLWTEMIYIMVENSVRPGLVYSHEVLGEHRSHFKGYEYVLINPNAFLGHTIEVGFDPTEMVMKMWHLACHEIAHGSCSDHDEDFTMQEGRLSRETAWKIVEPEHFTRLRWLAKYVQYTFCKPDKEKTNDENE